MIGKRIVLTVLSSLTLVACTNKVMFADYQSVPVTGWSADSVLTFRAPVTDTTHAYNILLHIRHTDAYPYQNMWLFTGQNGLPADTLELFLADDRGRWLGDGHATIAMPVLYRENVRFTDSVYTLTIQHGMRNLLLYGVSEIGVEIRQNE